MPEKVPNKLAIDVNRTVLAHLDSKSAHSDIAEALSTAVKPLGDVQLFCPDWKQYRYVTASTKGIIFGFAIGMIGCYKGYNSNKGTEGVGRSANSAVVIASLLVFILDLLAVQITDLLRLT